MCAVSEAAASSQQPASSAANGAAAATDVAAAEPAAKRQKVGQSADEDDAGGIKEGQVGLPHHALSRQAVSFEQGAMQYTVNSTVWLARSLTCMVKIL
jgi:hypothetical protein